MKFSTLEEVRRYLAGPSIECLICGHSYKRLQYKHLEMHNLDADGYRERFGIPWTFSLTSAPSRQASSDSVSDACRRFLSHSPHEGGPKGERRRPSCPAVAKRWEMAAELGRDVNARRRVIVSCSKGCGAQMETTALTAMQPIFCDACASPGALRLRRLAAKKKAA